MNELQVFESAEFGRVRTISIDDEPWFCAQDIGLVLQHTNIRQVLKERVDEEDKRVILKSVILTLENDSNNPVFESVPNRGMTFVNESGLYCLVLCSTLPEAKAFRRWITHDVIPAIRKHGAYLTPEKIEEVLLNPDTIIAIATQLKEEKGKRETLERENAALASAHLTWDKKDFVDAAVRRLGYYMPGYTPAAKFSAAWREFKRELLYKHSISLEARLTFLRNSSSHPSQLGLIDTISGDVEDKAVSIITSICREREIDIEDLLKNIPV